MEAMMFVVVLAGSWAGVGFFRRWSLERDLLDVPNERSSHAVPTPRGGGLVIAVSSLAALGVLTVLDRVDLPWQFFAGAVVIAAISLVDDFRAISPFLRLGIHGLSALIVMSGTGGFNVLNIPFVGSFQLGFAGDVLTFFWIIWLVNAYNFMDGIDGIAALQAVTAGVAWSALGHLEGISAVVMAGGVLAASSLGFLLHNWAPARIFMGDVGSAFLGFAFAVMPLIALGTPAGGRIAGLLPAIGVLFVFLFVADSVFTFVRRLFRGEKVWLAHREHVYQRMVIAGAGHASVTKLYGVAAVLIATVVVVPRFFGVVADKYALAFGLLLSTVLFVFHRRIAEGLKGEL